MEFLHVQVEPLNLTYGIKILGDGVSQQKYSRDDNAYYPNYSAIKPLVLTLAVNVQDPDKIIPSGPITLDRIECYKNQKKPSNRIYAGADYEITTQNGQQVLKVKRNTPVSEPYDILICGYYTNIKTGMQECVEDVIPLGTKYYESTLLSLRTLSPSDVIINPLKIVSESDWQNTLSAKLMSGEFKLDDKNAVYWWYVQEGKYVRKVGLSDTWAVTQPNANGTYPPNMVVDTSKISKLKLYCRAAYAGEGESTPSSPTNAALSVSYNLMVKLPAVTKVEVVKEKGFYLEPKDFVNGKDIVCKCEVTAGGSVVPNPEKYFNMVWDKVLTKTRTRIGYGEYLRTTLAGLGATMTSIPSLEPSVYPKVGYWDIEGSIYSGLAATPVLQYGVNQIADKLGAYLVSCPDGINPVIIGKLKNNNWNRFEDGSLAPTTVNSAAEDKGYNIMYGWVQTIHTIENALVGDEIVSLFGESPFEYNGAKSVPIPPTLICPGLPALVDGKFRSMYFKYRAGEGGSDGYLGIKSFNNPQRTYPKTALSQFTTGDYAVAHNKDTTKTIPFAPLMDWHLLNITNALMNKFGTVYLHDPNKFGGGISSNTEFTSSSIGTTGVYYKINASDPYVYQRLSDTPSFSVDTSGTKKTWNEIISKSYPRMQCMEIQMALSYAVEHNVQPNTSFVFDGAAYKYFNIPGAKTLLEGEMNAKLVKYIELKPGAFDTSGALITIYSMFICLQTSAVYGMDLVSADALQYAGAGIERIVTISDVTQGNNPKNRIDNYLCIHQNRLVLDKTVKKTGSDQFLCESATGYVYLGINNQQSGHYMRLSRGARIGNTLNGSLVDNTAYNDNANYTNGVVGERIRLGVRVRGYGSIGVCSARHAASFSPLSSSLSNTAGGFQVRLPEGALSATENTSITEQP